MNSQSYRLVTLKEVIPFYIEGKPKGWNRDKLRLFVEKFDCKLDDTSVADLWNQIERVPRVIQAEKSSSGKSSNVTQLKSGKRKREH